PLDPLFHLPPLRLGEKVSTYFRTGHRKQKSRMDKTMRLFYVHRGRLAARVCDMRQAFLPPPSLRVM
ncbi:hypothetical protein, partial [Burkholderia diffusa]|uniref:hypothetical protein n=1 Tax=Burkholderia diffusa TaxID=488732 RepID=UPI001E3526B1